MLKKNLCGNLLQASFTLMKNVKYWNINSDACFKIIHLSNWVMKKSYFWFFVLNEFPKSKSNALKFLCPTNRIVFDPKLLVFHEKTNNFWVPIVMRKRKRIILMQWYSSIKQNLKYQRFELKRVLHTNLQKSVQVPFVNESSIFKILNKLCNLLINFVEISTTSKVALFRNRKVQMKKTFCWSLKLDNLTFLSS